MNMLPTLASIELKITELSQMYFLYETNQFAELLNIWKGKDKTLLKAFKLKNQINIPEYTPNPNENIVFYSIMHRIYLSYQNWDQVISIVKFLPI